MALKKLLKSGAKLKPMNPIGFTDPGGDRPTPNRPTSVYQSKKPSFSGFQDPGLTAGQFGFDSSSRGGKSNSSGKSNRPTTPGSGYTPGGDSFQNYSQQDQATMFRQAGGRDKFLQKAMAMQDKYPRSLDYQKFLDRSKRYQTGQILGGREVVGPDGIMRLQMAGADTPMRDAQGRQILSMMAPELTAQAPTLSQLMGDIKRGFGSMAQGLAEKGTPMMNLAKDLYGGVQNFFTGSQGPGTTAQGPQNLGLTPGQMNLYNNLVGNGMNPAMALEQAKRYMPNFAMGGIATLN